MTAAYWHGQDENKWISWQRAPCVGNTNEYNKPGTLAAPCMPPPDTLSMVVRRDPGWLAMRAA